MILFVLRELCVIYSIIKAELIELGNKEKVFLMQYCISLIGNLQFLDNNV